MNDNDHYPVMRQEVLYSAIKIVYFNFYKNKSKYLDILLHKKNYKNCLECLYSNDHEEYLQLKRFCASVCVIDGTFGAGGHSSILLDWGFQVIGIDCDNTVLTYVNKLKDKYKNFRFYLGQFSEVVGNINLSSLGNVIMLADLGMSTMQINSDRGFSYKTNGQLSMNMDPQGVTLASYLRLASLQDLTNLLKQEDVCNYNRIAHNIINYRIKHAILTSKDLVAASKIYKYKDLSVLFQAFRRYINKENHQINKLLHLISFQKIPMIIISFHSLEHSIIHRYRGLYNQKFILFPTEKEVTINTASRSAQLRCYYNFKYS